MAALGGDSLTMLKDNKYVSSIQTFAALLTEKEIRSCLSVTVNICPLLDMCELDFSTALSCLGYSLEKGYEKSFLLNYFRSSHPGHIQLIKC